ncbi:hypothetical protein ACTD5D_06390 [Nocardia takedensis]|uniref:hypothetical protein n=1 Tax=Nocardia takedensis TaxID=259390 RepID=UPI00059325DB|nr:hypothetical protein [Nocardia takedensis]
MVGGRLWTTGLAGQLLGAGLLAAVLTALLIGRIRLGRVVREGLWSVRWLRCGLLLAARSR